MDKESASERRSFLTRVNAGVAGLAALALGGIARAQVKPAATAVWEPTRHEKDNWLDQPQFKHRLLFDNISPEGLAQSLLFTDNYLRVSRDDYGLQNSDLGVLIVLRHRATGFGFKDAMWDKYGVPIAARSAFEDPKTKAAPKLNVYNTPGYGAPVIDSLVKQGVQIAVCSVATRNLSGLIAQAIGGNAEAINAELTANLIGGARMVPAGISTINRAQERGYTLALS